MAHPLYPLRCGASLREPPCGASALTRCGSAGLQPCENAVQCFIMPIFEYTCQSCGHRFEHLTRADHEAACPSCDGTTLDKHLSTFAVGANGRPTRADAGIPACGACGDPRGPGACSMN